MKLDNKIHLGKVALFLPGTIPKALDQPQEEGLDDLPTPLDNQEDIEMQEGVVHRDSAVAVGFPVVDHNYTGHPAKKSIKNKLLFFF